MLLHQCLGRNHRRSPNRTISFAGKSWQGWIPDVSPRSAARLAGGYSNSSPAAMELQPFWLRGKSLSGCHLVIFSKSMDRTRWSCSLATTIAWSVVPWFLFVPTAEDSDVWDSYWLGRAPNRKTFGCCWGKGRMDVFEIFLEYFRPFSNPSFGLFFLMFFLHHCWWSLFWAIIVNIY